MRAVTSVVIAAIFVAGCGGDGDEDDVEQAAVSSPPTLSSFSPAKAVQGSSVTIFGTNFTTDAAVSFNGTPSPMVVYLSATRVIATVPTGATTGPISITTPFGSATSSGAFQILPLVGAFSPVWAFRDTTVTVTGSGFTGATVLKLRNGSHPFTVIDDATIQFTYPGQIDGPITVTNAAGTDASAEWIRFLPVVTSFTPIEGLVGSSMTIRGGGFTTATAVKFGTTAAAFTIIDDTTIQATVPNAGSPVKLAVIASNVQRVTTATFMIIKKPVIASFTPASSGLPVRVTISGQSFGGTTSVRLGATELSTFTVTPTKILVDVPFGTPSGKFTVANAAGSTTSTGTFTAIDRCAGVTCTASDACHVAGVCDPYTGTCSNPTAPEGTACSDGDACTQVDVCQLGTCVGASPVTCADVACEGAQTCNPATGACDGEPLADGTACNDGDACTQTDACQTGSCVGASPVVCADVPCEGPQSCNSITGACDGAVLPDGTSCQADACTIAGTCSAGACNETMSCDTPVTNGLVGRWQAEESADDDLGVNHGVWIGTPRYDVSPEGSSFFLTTTTVDIADHPSFHFGTGDFTVSFLLDVGFHSGAVSKWNGTSPNGWYIESQGDDIVFATRADGHVTEARMPRNQTAGMKTVTARRKDGVISIFLGGDLKDSTFELAATDVTSDVPIRFYALGNNDPTRIDDVRVYNRALDDDEIRALAKCRPNYCVPNTSCNDILASGRSTGDGLYWINRPRPGYWFQERAYCDMTNDGGGWTLGFNIGADPGPTNLAGWYSGWSTSPLASLYGIGLTNMNIDTTRQFKLDCYDSSDNAYRKMFVTGINVFDVGFQARGAFNPSSLQCSQSADMSNPKHGGQCIIFDDNDHTYWGNAEWDMSWALYAGAASGAKTLRHCHNSGSGYWNRGRIWFR